MSMSSTCAPNMKLNEGLHALQAFISQIRHHPHLISFLKAFPCSLPSLMITLTVLIATFSSFFRRTSKSTTRPLPPLKALLHILTPVCSLWPQTYIKPSKAGYYRIPLKTIIDDIIAGKIELRAPAEDIKQLLAGRGRLNIGGCALVLSLGPSLRLGMMLWWMKSTLYAGKKPRHLDYNPSVQHENSGEIEIHQPPLSSDLGLGYLSPEPSPQTRKQESMLKCKVPCFRKNFQYSILPDLLPTLPPHVLEKLAIATTLDSSGLAYLEKELLSAPPGSLALLEFTTCDPRMSLGSTPWILSVLPLAHGNKDSRTTTLAGVLTLLEGVCVVLSVQNVSRQYAVLLEDYAHGLECGEARKSFLAGQGAENTSIALRAWRTERLWAHWESACYTTGGLARWVICVRRLSAQ